MNTYWHTHSHTYYQFESRRKKCATITLLFAIKHNYAQQCPITHYLKSCLHCSSSCVSFFINWAVYDVFHFQDINNDVSQPENLQSMHPFKNHFVCSSKHYIILVSNIFCWSILIHHDTKTTLTFTWATTSLINHNTSYYIICFISFQSKDLAFFGNYYVFHNPYSHARMFVCCLSHF